MPLLKLKSKSNLPVMTQKSKRIAYANVQNTTRNGVERINTNAFSTETVAAWKRTVMNHRSMTLGRHSKSLDSKSLDEICNFSSSMINAAFCRRVNGFSEKLKRTDPSGRSCRLQFNAFIVRFLMSDISSSFSRCWPLVLASTSSGTMLPNAALPPFA